MVALWWASALVVVQTYVVFPLVVLARGHWRPRPHRVGEVTPTVSVVVAAHDEAAAIAEKLRTVLDGDYPTALLQVLVASDGSTDATVAEAERAGSVAVLDLPRVGKAAALNAALERATGEVVVFTDANSRFEPDTIRRLVRPFADPEVGGVAGDQRYLDPAPAGSTGSAGSTTQGERSYWDLDRLLKVAESAGGNVIGATGALYAVRRHLVGTVPDGVTDDFTTSTGVIEQGHRLVFAADATVWEPVAGSAPAEFRRKVRVMTRGLQAVALRRSLLRPARHGFYAYQLANHKLLRRLMGLPLAGVAVASIACARRGPIYRLALVGQVAVYVPGAVALARPAGRVGTSRLGGLAGYFCLVNAAGLVAAFNVVIGRRIDRWEPERTG